MTPLPAATGNGNNPRWMNRLIKFSKFSITAVFIGVPLMVYQLRRKKQKLKEFWESQMEPIDTGDLFRAKGNYIFCFSFRIFLLQVEI